MSFFAYLHISASLQDNENQKSNILEFCHEKGLTPIKFIYDKKGGKTTWRNREINSILEKASNNDVIIASEIHHLGRTVIQALEIIEAALKKGISICIVKNNLIIQETQAFSVTKTLELAKKIEQEFLSRRIRKALEREKLKGKKLGRPKGHATFLKLDFMKDEILDFIKRRTPKRTIARTVGCSPTTLYNWLKRRLYL